MIETLSHLDAGVPILYALYAVYGADAVPVLSAMS